MDIVIVLLGWKSYNNNNKNLQLLTQKKLLRHHAFSLLTKQFIF